MKFTCARESLLDAFQKVAAAVAAKSTKPILSCVKATALDVGDDGLTLVAFDAEVGIRYQIRGVDVREPGSAILPLTLPKILRESYEPEVTVTATDDGAKVRIGASRFETPGYPVLEFPDLPEFASEGNYAEVKAGDLKRLIKLTAYAADKKYSTSRFTLSGILWELSPKLLRFVATDSKRLAVAECEATLHGDAETSPKSSHLVPPKALALLEKNLTDDGELVRVSLGANEAMFQTERATIYTRLIEGRYPPYRDIIAQTRKQANVKVVLPVLPFLGRVKQAAIMAKDEARRIDLTFTDGKVMLAANGVDLGKSDVEMLLPDYTGKAVDVGLDPTFVVEFLRAVEGGEVTLNMNDGNSPLLFKAGDSVSYLVMPLVG